MILAFNLESGWKLVELLQPDDHWILDVPSERMRFNQEYSTELDSFITPAGDNDGCQMWLGGCNNASGNRKPIPYFLPHSPHYPYMIPARHMLLARHLDLHYLHIHGKLRISLTCTTPRCVAISHCVPETMRARYARKEREFELIPTEYEQSQQSELLEYAKTELAKQVEPPRGPKISRRNALIDSLLPTDEEDKS